jgi:hypothetical protein
LGGAKFICQKTTRKKMGSHASREANSRSEPLAPNSKHTKPEIKSATTIPTPA